MSTISIAEASRQLSQIINRASYGREIVILTSRGKPKAVLLGVESFQQLIGFERNPKPTSVDEFRTQFRKALEESGYRTPQDIVELVRSVKKEIADETFQKGDKSAAE